MMRRTLNPEEIYMSKVNIVRAWKDAEYRQALSEAERALLPQHPAGIVELSDDDLAYTAGGTDTGTDTWQLVTYGCCPTVFPCTGGGTHNIATIGCCPQGVLLEQ
jgi:mersacidin/lichenicidin family type 2 lantibiotic